MKTLQTMATLLAVGVYVGGVGVAAHAHSATNVVLVHGAFADESSWSKVIPLLQAKGFHVTTVANRLTSFADGVWATREVLADQEGPTVLVGHSYGGVVITEAGADPKVASLVYVAAFAPDADQSINEIRRDFPKPPGLGEVRPVPEGFLVLSRKGIEEDFAQDLSALEITHLMTTQPWTAGSIFNAKPAVASWHHKPAWYIVASNDRMIDPQQQKHMAKQIKAKTTVLPSSHVPMLSLPVEVVKVIEEAANGW